MKKKKKFNNIIDSWLLQKKVLVKESTYCRYIEIVNIYIRPYFGNMYTYQINNDIVNKYIFNLVHKNKLNNKTIKDITVLIKQIFKYAYINLNVVSPKCNKESIKILNKEEQEKLEKYLCSNINEINICILLCLYTGLRIGEVCALKWKNIDLDNGILNVTNTILRIKDLEGNNNKTKVIISTPKSYKSIRNIPIPFEILNYLKVLYKKVNNDENYILTNNLKYLEPRSFYYHYKKITKELELLKYNFHVLRHTFATRCISLGFDYKTLSEILGHSDVKITLSIYVHPSDELKIKSMEKLHLY